MGSRLRNTVRHLFELYCEVSPGDHVREPFISRKFPETFKNEEVLENIPKFTFPCQFECSFVQHYSFVLTSDDSMYTFCFCRYDPKTDKAIVLLSYLPWHDIFYKLLNCIANLLISSEKGELISFLEACHIRPPMPGHTLKVTYNAGHSVFSCQCPSSKLASIPENCNLTEYFSAVDTKCMAGLWAALLHERRVAIVASKPSRLSACVQAANATLFPMSWQHIFIPILPKHLVDYLSAPMPFLIGVPRSVMESVRVSDLGDVVILDVDANELRTPFNDLESLPSELISSLRRDLSDKHALGDAVSRAFLRALVCLIGGYRDAILIENGQLITFNAEAFIKTRTKNMQKFLREMEKSQIFRQFIDGRLELLNAGIGYNDEFEVECNNYADKQHTGSGHRLKQQYKDWAKNVKKEGGAFFKTVKDKVRQSGRNVKSAVRVMKNKIPKPGSHSSSINTTDNSRFSCGSVTPVSSASSDSSTAMDAAQPLELPLDLLNEMEYLFANSSSRRDSLPGTTRNNTELSVAEKSKTLSSNIPPRLPQRPVLPAPYPIVPTRKLVDISGAPVLPPRTHAAASNNAHFVSNITKNELNGTRDSQTNTIFLRFADNDKEKLKFTLSSTQRKGAPVGARPLPPPPPAPPRHTASVAPEPNGSDSDLIKLDDSPIALEDFDPLKCKERADAGQQAKAADSALLHEYGIDLNRFGLDFAAASPPAARPFAPFD